MEDKSKEKRWFDLGRKRLTKSELEESVEKIQEAVERGEIEAANLRVELEDPDAWGGKGKLRN